MILTLYWTSVILHSHIDPFSIAFIDYEIKNKSDQVIGSRHHSELSNIVTQLFNRQEDSSTGMELPSSRFSAQKPVHEEEYTSSNTRKENMATLTMRPGPLLPSPGALSSYDDRNSSRPRSEERSLPSIRQVRLNLQSQATPLTSYSFFRLICSRLVVLDKKNTE